VYFGWLILKWNLTSKRCQCLPFSRRDLPSHGERGILYLPLQLTIKSPSLHPVFGPAFTLLFPLSVVSTKVRKSKKELKHEPSLKKPGDFTVAEGHGHPLVLLNVSMKF